MGGVRRQVGHRHARPDQRGLVAHDVDAVEQVTPLPGIADVELVEVLDLRTHGVGLRQQRVDPDDVVACVPEHGVDGAADEARRPGEQHPHGTS